MTLSDGLGGDDRENWEPLATLDDRGENGGARTSRGVSASVGVCAGVKEYEIVILLKKESAVWEREPCVCAVVYLWVGTRIIC